MIIYKDYDTTDLLFNEPCEVDGIGKIYPVSIKDYKRFKELSSYVVLSRDYLRINNDIELLYAIITIVAKSKCEDSIHFKDLDKKIIETLKEISELFTIITKKEVYFNILQEGFTFTSKDNEVTIDSKNFEILRKVVLKMCLLKEPKVFKNKEVEKWYYKGIKAGQRGKKEIELDDIVSIVIQDMKYTFEYVYNLNIFQLYVLYARINNSVGYETLSKFRCVCEVKSKLEFNDGVISSLYKETELGDLLMSESELKGMI